MAAIFIFDASAMAALNELDVVGASPFQTLNDLHENDQVLFCDVVKDLCKKLYKDETIDAWVSPVWRLIRRLAEVAYADVQKVLDLVEDILDDDEEEAQALKTIALAYRLQCENKDVVVVSNETKTLDERCTVPYACSQLGITFKSVEKFLADESSSSDSDDSELVDYNGIGSPIQDDFALELL